MLAVRASGAEVFLACRAHAMICEHAQKAGIPVFVLPFRGNADLSTLFSLVYLIRKHKIDIVNTHSGKDTWVGGLAARIAGAKFIRTRHLSNPIRSSRTNFINELAHFVFTTGESVREDMIRNNRIRPECIESIPTGIDEHRFSVDCCDRAAARAALGISQDEIAIGMVAVLRLFKRHDFLLDVAQRICLNHDNVRFYLAGAGPVEERIRDKIRSLSLEGRVVMLGHVGKPEEVLRALDIFTLTSDSKEGVPQSVMQALMMELPVVATDVGSTKDLYKDDNFILLQPNDLEGFVQAFSDLIENPDLRAAYSSRARSYVVGRFSSAQMVSRILAVYQKLLVKP